MVKGKEETCQWSSSEKRFTVFTKFLFFVEGIFFSYYLTLVVLIYLKELYQKSSLLLIIKTDAHIRSRSLEQFFQFQNWNCPLQSSCFRLGEKKFIKALRGFQWKFRTLVRLREAPRRGEGFRRRRGSIERIEKQVRGMLRRGQMLRRGDSVGQSKTKLKRITRGRLAPRTVRSCVAVAGLQARGKVPRVEGLFWGHITLIHLFASPTRPTSTLLCSWGADLCGPHHLDPRSLASGWLGLASERQARAGYQRTKAREDRGLLLSLLPPCTRPSFIPLDHSSFQVASPPLISSPWAPAGNISSSSASRVVLSTGSVSKRSLKWIKEKKATNVHFW